jgi:hypothetical protein
LDIEGHYETFDGHDQRCSFRPFSKSSFLPHPRQNMKDTIPPPGTVIDIFVLLVIFLRSSGSLSTCADRFSYLRTMVDAPIILPYRYNASSPVPSKTTQNPAASELGGSLASEQGMLWLVKQFTIFRRKQPGSGIPSYGDGKIIAQGICQPLEGMVANQLRCAHRNW